MTTFCRLFFCLWLLAYDGLSPFGQTPEMETEMNKHIDLTTVGGRIKAKRIEAGMTQEQLAEKLYVKFSMISRYESAKSNLSVDTLKEIAEALGCSAAYLIEGIELELSEEEKELIKIFKSLNRDEVRKVAMEQLRILAGI